VSQAAAGPCRLQLCAVSGSSGIKSEYICTILEDLKSGQNCCENLKSGSFQSKNAVSLLLRNVFINPLYYTKSASLGSTQPLPSPLKFHSSNAVGLHGLSSCLLQPAMLNRRRGRIQHEYFTLRLLARTWSKSHASPTASEFGHIQ
jgi:hypothetical protein